MELVAVEELGRQLKKYEAVPGCVCVSCTGVIPPSPRQGALRRGDGDDLTQARLTPITGVLEYLGSQTSRRGRKLVATCPLHNDTNPSMSIDESGNLWFCFTCGTGGDSIQLVMEALGIGFQEALRLILQNI
mgnify:FL=1